jgi:hypothetical protein
MISLSQMLKQAAFILTRQEKLHINSLSIRRKEGSLENEK